MRVNRKTLEMKILGAEPSWTVDDITKTNHNYELMRGLYWYNYHYKLKDFIEPTLRYAKEVLQYSDDDLAIISKRKDWEFHDVGKLAILYYRGFPFTNKKLNNLSQQIEDKCRSLLKPCENLSDNKTYSVKSSPHDKLKYKTYRTIIHDFEQVYDSLCFEKKTKDVFDLKKSIERHNTKEQGLVIFYDYLNELLNEYEIALSRDDKDITEAFEHMSQNHIKKIIKLLKTVSKEIKAYQDSTPKKKRARQKKVKTAQQQIEKLQYCKSFEEDGLSSINPLSIPSAMSLWVYNTRYKKFILYVSQSPKGFSIKGTTLYDFDPNKSKGFTIRKPKVIIPKIQKAKTIKELDKILSELTTKEQRPNGRINKDTILVKVL